MPWLAASALTVAVASGLLFFVLGGAPTVYLSLNAGSLVLALAIMVAMPVGRLRDRAAVVAVAFCLAAMAATLVSGFDLDGVRRWLPFGPVRLHAALLFLPAMFAVLPRLSDRWQFAAVVVAAAIIVMQPDFAAALALAGGYVGAFWRRWRNAWIAGGLGIVLLCAVATGLRPDPLAPVRFVEHVIGDGWLVHLGLGLWLFAMMLLPVAASAWTKGADRDRAWGVAGAWTGFAAASLVGAYPVPWVGYGASAILGYGVAIALLRGLGGRALLDPAGDRA